MNVAMIGTGLMGRPTAERFLAADPGGAMPLMPGQEISQKSQIQRLDAQMPPCYLLTIKPGAESSREEVARRSGRSDQQDPDSISNKQGRAAKAGNGAGCGPEVSSDPRFQA